MPHLLLTLCCLLPADTGKPIKILFLGDQGHHQPALRFRQLQPALAARGIDLTYTDKVESLNPQTLAGYDGLLIYANTTRISPEQEKALLDFVEGGKGFIPLHCASYCFLNSPKYIALVGAQFQRHDTGTFRTTIAMPDHPVMRGFKGFESWDETYVHTKHNTENRIVLETRAEGGSREPWTWVRTQGKGRVFYTAWGHDERTWGNPGFQNLVERGIRWAVGQDPSVVPPYADQPEMTAKRTDVKPFEYTEGRLPFYPPSRVWGVTGEPLKTMQKPLPPEESVKHFVMPKGFEPRLFVSEPDLGGKPIAMNWDERGRLWVAITVDYPNDLQPKGKGRDRILICEDTDGDGRADKFTVFAEKLSLPTSLAFYKGGLIIHQPPDTLYLRDTDGDGVADERKVLFTGWGIQDTHAGPSNLQWGFDNWLYGIVGYSGYYGKIGGEQHSFRQGFYRFRPDGSRMEFLRNTNNNSWGVGFSEDGELFGSTANGNPSVHVPIPNRYYESVRGWSSAVLPGIAGNAFMHPITDKVRQVDYHGHFTAGAGHALYTARSYPREYWNRTAFVNEPTGHLTATFRIESDGSTYRSWNAWNLVASDDEWTAPIVAEVGPDGNVWFIDWYNIVVQHNPTPPGFRTGRGSAYETPLRDKRLGRIYRLVYTGAPDEKPFTLEGATPEKLVETLKNPNFFWRRHAQRLLVERGQRDVEPALLALAADRSMDAVGLNPGAIHALWTLHGLGALDGTDARATAAAVAALKHPAASVRKNAVQVLPRNVDTARAVVDAGLVTDVDPHVRLQAILALADMPDAPGIADKLLAALGDDSLLRDRWLTDALTSAAAKHHGGFLAALARNWTRPLGGTRETLVLRVAEHHGREAPRDVAMLIDALADAKGPVADAILTGMAKGWPREKAPALSPESEQRLGQLVPKLTTVGRGRLVELTARWGSKALDHYAAEIAATMVNELKDEKAADSTRLKAAAQLIDFRRGDAEAARLVLAQITPRTAPELAQGLLDAVARSEAPATGAALLDVLPTLTPAGRSAALRALLGRADWTRQLLDAANAGKVTLSDLSLDQQQSLARHPNPQLAGRARRLLARAGGLPNPDRQKVIEELLPLTRKTGDAVAGKLVFKNNCAKCHTHSGEGAKVGPDLTGMAVHPKDHLLTEIIDPSRSVEGNYRQYTVATRSGRIISGLLASESRTAIEMIDVEAKVQTIQREDIEEMAVSPKSLMPEGFEKQLKPEEIVNLLQFLTQRGKYLPLPLEKVATAVSSRGMFYSPENQSERLVFADWGPKTFHDVPFVPVDPQGTRRKNVILLNGPEGAIPPTMPRSVSLPVNTSAKAIHMLSGVSGWGYPYSERGSVSLVVRLHYADGQTEDHPLVNGQHFADYVRRVNVPGSEYAFSAGGGRQIRYLRIEPKRPDKIASIEFVKGDDRTAPVVMAVTVEGAG